MKKILHFLFPIMLCSQSVYLPASHKVYKYLDKMEAKQIINGYRDEMKPLTRELIAHYLILVDTTMNTLTSVEREEQIYFKEEFYQEMHHLGYNDSVTERWHLYQYIDNPATINVDLIGGFTYQDRADGKFTRSTTNGLSTYGYVGNNTGFYFMFNDNREAGSYLNYQRPLSPIPSEVPSRNLIPRAFEYDRIDVQVNIDFGFATLSLEKMHNVWGAGERGNIILSDKSPSYPQIKLRASLGPKIEFLYFHGWLYSGIIDSTRSFQVPDIPGKLGFRVVNKQKYIASHMVEFTPWEGIDIAIGESEIYGSRNPELLYLIPIMFFKGAEHWMYDTDNSQIFSSLDVNVVKNYGFYFALFLDEFSTEDFARADRQRNQLAFTVGVRAYDLLFSETKIVLEYTRLNPWVYNHKFPDVTYQNHAIDLGHWLGQNGDLLFTQIMYQPKRYFNIGIQFESVRKGGELPTIRQYKRPTPEFLYSPLIKYQTFGIIGQLEIVRDAVFDFHFLQTRYTDEINFGKSDYNAKIDAFIGIRYNFY